MFLLVVLTYIEGCTDINVDKARILMQKLQGKGGNCGFSPHYGKEFSVDNPWPMKFWGRPTSPHRIEYFQVPCNNDSGVNWTSWAFATFDAGVALLQFGWQLYVTCLNESNNTFCQHLHYYLGEIMYIQAFITRFVALQYPHRVLLLQLQKGTAEGVAAVSITGNVRCKCTSFQFVSWSIYWCRRWRRREGQKHGFYLRHGSFQM